MADTDFHEKLRAYRAHMAALPAAIEVAKAMVVDLHGDPMRDHEPPRQGLTAGHVRTLVHEVERLQAREKQLLQEAREADAFNAQFKVGDEIVYFEIVGEGEGKRFKTRTPAEVLSGHTAVVWLSGKSGCVCCSHCFAPPIPDSSYADCHGYSSEEARGGLSRKAKNAGKAE